MDEYIKREAVKDLLERYGAAEDALTLIDSIKASDVAPVRHGQWIIDSAGGKIACSDCGCIYLGYNGRLTPNYCPNCGADMRVGE